MDSGWILIRFWVDSGGGWDIHFFNKSSGNALIQLKAARGRGTAAPHFLVPAFCDLAGVTGRVCLRKKCVDNR